MLTREPWLNLIFQLCLDMVIFKQEKGNNVNIANHNNSHNLSGTFCERNTAFKAYHVIPITVSGGWLASCKWRHYGSGNWDSEIFSSLPMFPEPVIGKAGFRQDLSPEPTRLTITPCFLWRQDQCWVHQGAHSGLLPLITFVGPISIWASQSGVLSYQLPDTHREGHSLQMGQIMCAYHKCWFSAHFQIYWDLPGADGNDYVSGCILCLSKTQRHSGAGTYSGTTIENLLCICYEYPVVKPESFFYSHGRVTLSHS